VLNNNRGFTLIELVLVFAISIIMLNAISLTLNNNDKRILNKVALEIQMELRQAQRLAIANGTKYEVEFDISKNKYNLKKQDNEVIGYKIIKTLEMPKEVELISVNANGNRTIQYTPLGTTGNACTISLRTEKYALKMTVNVGSGRIEIKEFIKL
jgi:type II secretion system protein H